MDLRDLVEYAAGNRPADLLLKNARIINVYSGDIQINHIAVKDGIIIGMGEYDAYYTEDLKETYVAPGLIDPHVHIESSMAGVPEFARTIVAHGTTAVVADPHEIANVLGVKGISYMLQSADHALIDIFYALPSCVPASFMESSGAVLSDQDLLPFCNHLRVVALAEMMNFPGVVHGDEQVIRKLALAKSKDLIMDGHAPGLYGKGLNAYVATGISSDHECTTATEAMEKLAAGMHIMVREGTAAKNLEELFPMINPQTAHRMMWCTDDRHPHDLLADGHIDAILRKAIGMGLDPVIAVQMATLNPARYFGLKNLGAIAPGKKANMILFSDLQCPMIEKVYFNGRPVVENGRLLPSVSYSKPDLPTHTIHVNPDSLDFAIPAVSPKIHVIELIENQIITGHGMEVVSKDTNGLAVSDMENDILKIAVVERHKNTGNIGMGFVKGFGLRAGALASSVAHDSHNIIVVGTNDADMKAAVREIVRMGGGMAAVNNGLTLAGLALPIAGLMSAEPMATIRDQLDALLTAAKSLGAESKDPFMALSFLALPVIPKLKITDKGIVDVEKFQIIPLFES